MPVVDQFIADLKDAVREARDAPEGKGTMVILYGACHVHCRLRLCGFSFVAVG